MTQLSDRELATVLAALRVFQGWTSNRTFSTIEYFTDHKPLQPEEIDELCERLNTTDDYDLVGALSNLVGTGAQHELACDLAEHGPDEDDQCIWCDARAALAKATEKQT